MTIANRSLLSKTNVAAPFEGIANEINQCANVLKCVYDFSVLGGAIGSVGLLNDQGLPALLPLGAVVTRSFTVVQTTPTSGGAATIALGTGLAANDVLAATAFGSVTGNVEGVSTGASTAFKGPTTNANGTQPTATIATAALTAGKFAVYLHYVV